MVLARPFLLPNNLGSFSQIVPKHHTHAHIPLPMCKLGRVQCMTSTSLSQPATEIRHSANYQPSIWSYDYVQSLKTDYEDVLSEDHRVRKLQEDVRRMIKNENAVLLPKLELIDDIQRLGLAYLFEEEITEALDRFVSQETSNGTTEKSLHATALRFRLLREHGYDVCDTDMFNSFKDQNGEFKDCIRKDVKGMLSLYEASFLGFQGEDILDEAMAFTTMHLKTIKGDEIRKGLLDQVSHSLELPLHHRIERLEARWYIEAYAKKPDANHFLLELAKLDFNMVQSTLKRDLKDISLWWKDMGLAYKLSFSRDRLMECFFWTVGMVYQPQFSNVRKGLTKVTSLITTIDDVYDVYGTLDELELFTTAVERWDINAVEDLPEYMKICFLALYNTVNEMVYDTLKVQGVNVLPYLKKAWSDMLKAFLQEARWSNRKDMPAFKDYFENAVISVSGIVILVHAYFLLEQNITKQALDCLEKENYHDLLRMPSVIFRLCNDLGTSKAELERGETASSILCYMNESNMSEESASRHIKGLIGETWKKMNRDGVSESPFTKTFIETTANLARISHCTYQYGDGHGAPDSVSKDRVQSVIIEPITL
ncbi:Beta-ocimene synthase [Quillaja saponaria]|uniref:Beta-ocimene synthase n=1 Tax=Quillaja saponaria TaxID=32244 RepID=A0AAD7LTV4_QUISA|nr:Beta-ocimene synthase [Quillaja saponaria]